MKCFNIFLIGRNSQNRFIRHFSSSQNAEWTSSAPTIHQTITGRKRFYKNVSIDIVEEKDDAATTSSWRLLMKVSPEKPLYKVLLDGKTLKTPGRNPLYVPSMALAAAIASEWDMQTNLRGIQPATMPLMSLTCTAIDQIAVEPITAIDVCMTYLPTDSALFFASDDDRILLRKQKELYKPVIRWLQRAFDIELVTTQEFTGKLAHSPATVAKIRHLVESLDPFLLTCLQSATMELKSIVLALAFFARFASADQAIAYARVEEEFQAEIWGTVEGGHDLDRLNCKVRISSIDTFLRMIYDDHDMKAILNASTK